MKRKQRRIAAALSIVIVAIPLAAFMPWSGTAEAERYSGEPTPIISPSPLLTLAPEPEEQEYIPDAAEVEALAKKPPVQTRRQEVLNTRERVRTYLFI